MGLKHKTRRRLSLLILMVGLPVYIAAVVAGMTFLFPDPLDRPAVFVEFLIYVALGIVWALPLKFVFKGVGQADPDDPPRE